MPPTQDSGSGGRGSPLAQDNQGQLIDVSSGQVIRPGDPNWNPEYSQILASQAPPGQHWVFPNGFDATLPDGGGHLESNSLPWYEDPALLGAIGVAGVGAGLAAAGAGAGEGAAGAGGAASGSSLPAGIYGTAGTGAGAATGAGFAGTALGTGSRLLGAASDVASGLGALGSGLTTGAAAGANIGNAYGRNLIGLYDAENAAARNQLAQSEYLNTTLPAALAKQSVRGDILSNARDVSFADLPSGIPNIQVSGGLRPSMFSPTTRQLGVLQSANALKTAQSPPTFTNPTAPNIPAPSIPGGGTQALLGAGIGGNILQRLLPFLNTTKPNVNPNSLTIPGPDTGYG